MNALQQLIGCFLLLVPLLSAQAAVEQESERFSDALTAYQSRDFTRAFQIFSDLARNGHARSQTIVAIMYRYGEGVEPDATRARDWYLKAANQGYAPAQFSLASMLLGGEVLGGEVLDGEVLDGEVLDGEVLGGEVPGGELSGDEVTPSGEAAGLRWMRLAAEAGHQRAIDYLATSGPVNNPGENATWTRDWDLRLPNEIRYGDDARNGFYRVEMGRFDSLHDARHRWQLLLSTHPGPLSSISPIFRQTLFDNTAAFLLQVGEFTTSEAAQRLCQQLKPTPCRVVFR